MDELKDLAVKLRELERNARTEAEAATSQVIRSDREGQAHAFGIAASLAEARAKWTP